MNFIITRYDLGPGFFPSSPPPNIYIYIPSKNQQVFLSRPHTRPTLVRNPKFIEIISKYYKYPMLKQSQGPNLTFFGFNLGRLLITRRYTKIPRNLVSRKSISVLHTRQEDIWFFRWQKFIQKEKVTE
jgi:hypothetical protein